MDVFLPICNMPCRNARACCVSFTWLVMSWVLLALPLPIVNAQDGPSLIIPDPETGEVGPANVAPAQPQFSPPVLKPTLPQLPIFNAPNRVEPMRPQLPVTPIPQPEVIGAGEEIMTSDGLYAQIAGLRSVYGGVDYDVPLREKAEFFEQTLWQYHLTPYNQVHHFVILPQTPGERFDYRYGSDVSTWNGALLAALSLKYAVTKDPVTLARIETLIEGLHFYQSVTGAPGLLARCVMQSDEPVHKCTRQYISPEGTSYFYRTDPAKGTYNQVVCGYISYFLFAASDCRPEIQALAREDLSKICWRVVKYKYELREADRSKTQYGDMRPLIGNKSVPFNAQVAYLIVSAGQHFQGSDQTIRDMVWKEFRKLRVEHHVYYENPLRHLIVPQRVGFNPIVKGMNDRNHVMNAAFWGVMLELFRQKSENVDLDKKFCHELGQSMFWTMERIAGDRNALCNFMWTGMLTQPEMLQTIIPEHQARVAQQMPILTRDGIEQLRRFRLDRFSYTGERVETPGPTWVDVRQAKDCYYWKSDPKLAWKFTGERSDAHTCSIDYLFAYWMMRFFRLDEQYAQWFPGDPILTLMEK